MTFFFRLKWVFEAYAGIRVFYDDDYNPMKYSDRCQQTLNRLIAFVERCDFSNNKSIKFICKNWRDLSTKKLIGLWKKEYGEVKTGSCFRSQISSANKTLLVMFGDDWAEELMDNRCDDLSLMLDIYELGDSGYKDIFMKEIAELIKGNEQFGTYELEDIKKEIETLKRYVKKDVEQDIKSIDVSKLAYIKRVLDQPIIYDKKMNKVKFELLQSLKNKQEGEDDMNMQRRIENELSVQQKNVIVKVAKKNDKMQYDSNRKAMLFKFFYYAYVPEGIEEYLSKFSAREIREVVDCINSKYNGQ